MAQRISRIKGTISGVPFDQPVAVAAVLSGPRRPAPHSVETRYMLTG